MSAAFGQVVVVPAAEKDIITILNTVAKSAEKGPKKNPSQVSCRFQPFLK